MLKTPIAILIMLLFFDSIRNSYMYLAWFEAACLAGISQKTGIECSRFPCDQNPHNFAGVWEFRTESLTGASTRSTVTVLQNRRYGEGIADRRWQGSL